MRILVTGGCGYVGSVLVPKLLKAGHRVAVVDVQWFGNYLAAHQDLTVHMQDFRDQYPLRWYDAVIHLAAIANDPTGDLDPKLTWEVNALGTMELAKRAAAAGVKHFIYASSGSVYGVSNEEKVTEDTPCFPLSEYNKTKMVAERCVLSYADRMVVQVVRPATVCGYSPRMRLDVVVNMLTMQWLTKGKITVLGGDQMRPNLHIDDMTDLYLWMLERPYVTGVFNASRQNLTVLDIAQGIAMGTMEDIDIHPSTDPRSYRMNSDKLTSLGFIPQRTVADAVIEIIHQYRQGKLTDEDDCYNIRTMKALCA